MTAISEVLRDKGYVVFPAMFSSQEVQQLHAAGEETRARFLAHVDESGAAEPAMLRHLTDPRWHSGPQTWCSVLEAVADPRCLQPLEDLLGEPVLFRSTALFFNPRTGGSEGDWHRDPQFMLPDEDAVRRHFDELSAAGASSMPVEGVQLQIALVDNDDLEYVPGSASRYDTPEEWAIRCADGRRHAREGGMPDAVRLALRAGDAVVFNPAGLHRGRYLSTIERRTLLFTYTGRSRPVHDRFVYQPWLRDCAWTELLSPRARDVVEEFLRVFQPDLDRDLVPSYD